MQRGQVGRNAVLLPPYRDAARQGDSVKHFQLRQVHDFYSIRE